MTRLISKIQYNNFDTGEFIEEEQRTFEETIELIERFPWNEQRENIIISLTNPSITIHGKNEDYLKFALSYNGRYVLHYFDNKQVLFSKSFSRASDAYKYIENYFNFSIFDTKDFRKENTAFQKNLKHFVSQAFCYEITPDIIGRYILSTSAINLAFAVFIIIIFFVKPGFQIDVLTIIVLFLMIFIIGGGLNLILFFNYYQYAKNKILIMSRGNEIFYFGNKGNLSKYNKGDIIRFTTSEVRSSRNRMHGFAVVTIELKNGTDLNIPNLLVDHMALEQKLQGIPKRERHRFPLI